MGIHILRRASELGDALILAPERFDPRRTITVTPGFGIDSGCKPWFAKATIVNAVMRTGSSGLVSSSPRRGSEFS